MFYHGYESYMKFGYPFDELQPLSCTGHDTWGRYYGITMFVCRGGGQHLKKLENSGALEMHYSPLPHTHPFHLDLSI